MPEEKPITPERKAEKKSVLDNLHRKQEMLRQERSDLSRGTQKRKHDIDL